LLVILENAPVSSVLIEYELGIREPVRKINRVAAGHHLVLITIRHQHRVMNARQIGRGLTPPGMDSLQLGDESDERNRFIAVFGTLFQPFQKLPRRPAAIGGFGEEEIVFRMP
jgi:hypothetical protein